MFPKETTPPVLTPPDAAPKSGPPDSQTQLAKVNELAALLGGMLDPASVEAARQRFTPKTEAGSTP